ncbi:flagellar filament capping protein FliD [Pseudomonadota bacterium]
MMATITAPGIGSGLDINSIIGQLMALEQRPILALQQKEAGYHAELSALGQLRSAVSGFQSAAAKLADFSDFNLNKATSADTAKFTASASKTAAIGTYDIEVLNLATAEKQGSAVQPDSDTTTFGVAGDKMKIDIGTDSFSVETGGKTLSEIATAINDASDNVGVTASIVQETDTQFYLVLTSNDVGLDNAMTIAFEDSVGAPIADPLTMAVLPGYAADDARIKVDGAYTIQRSSNTITDAFEGVTLNLLEETTAAVKLDITESPSLITSAVQGLAEAYNTLQQTLKDLGEGELSGDSTLRLVENKVRSVFNTPPTGLSGSFSSLSDIGLSFEKDGTLSVDSAKVSDAVASDMDALEELFSNDDQGYAFRLDALLENFLETDGAIDAKEDGLSARIDDGQDRMAAIAVRLESTERRLRAQFSALDSLMGSMQTTSAFLTQQLTALSNLLPSNRNN